MFFPLNLVRANLAIELRNIGILYYVNKLLDLDITRTHDYISKVRKSKP